MYNQLLQSAVGPSGMVYPPVLFAGAANDGSAASFIQQLQQEHQAGLMLGPAGIYGLPHRTGGNGQQQPAFPPAQNAYIHQAALPANMRPSGQTGSTQLSVPSGTVFSFPHQQQQQQQLHLQQLQEHLQQLQQLQHQQLQVHRQPQQQLHAAPPQQLPQQPRPAEGPPAATAADALGDEAASSQLAKALIDWRATFSASLKHHPVLPPDHPSKGIQGLQELRLGAFEVLFAETPQAADVAVEVLRSRMWDGIIAMDMEWKPDTMRGESNPVALLQLSSAGLVVLIRTLEAGGLPEAFRTAIVEDSDVELVVAAWSNNDERKFEESFGLQTFWCKITDIQKVAKTYGHSKTGVKSLVQALLEPSVAMPKAKKVTISDWSAPVLQPDQLKYAILDAACAEHVFRCLEQRF